LATASFNAVRLWNAAGIVVREKPPLPPGHDAPVLALAISKDEKVMASGGADNAARIWDIRGARGGQRIALDQPRLVPAVAVAPNGRALVHSSGPSSLKAWDLVGDKPKEIATLTDHKDSVRAVVYSPDGKSVATASDDRSVRLWDMTLVRPFNRYTFDG